MGDTSLDRSAERAYLPAASPPRNHGHTTAAWVTVLVVLVGSLISALAVMAGSQLLFWVGLGVALLGLLAGRILAVLGLGQPRPETGQAQGSDPQEQGR